jgi:2-C-methyl-D-erythritol 4-phosphate cytidylyltransferase
MRVSVIVAAGGAGTRLGGGTPKGLKLLGGAPLFLYSVRTFARCPFVREIVLVVPPPWVDRVTRRWGAELGRLKVALVVPGGERRQDSVLHGLRVAREELVLVHDAARPFVTAEAIRRTARAAARHGAAVAALPATDTIKIVDGGSRVTATPRRDRVRAAQTPQGFRRRVLLGAYGHSSADATDDAELVERAGGRVVVVDGDPHAFKVTTPEDWARAARIIKYKT